MADRRVVWRWLQVVLGLAVVGLAVRALSANWDAFQAQDITWRFSLAWLAASVVIVFGMYAVLIEAWRRVVVGLGQRLGFVEAARIWALASLGKYIPGKVWAVAGAAALSKQAGVDPRAAVTAALVLQALAIGSGLVVTAVTAPHALGQGGWEAGFVVAGIAVAALVIVTAATVSGGGVPRGVMVQAFLANCVAWVGYGAAFLCLAIGTVPDAALTVSQAVGAFTGSYLVGLVALFAPGGIGARESAMLLVLAPVVGPKLALALAVVSRLQLTITELGVALPFLLGARSPHRTVTG